MRRKRRQAKGALRLPGTECVRFSQGNIIGSTRRGELQSLPRSIGATVLICSIPIRPKVIYGTMPRLSSNAMSKRGYFQKEIRKSVEFAEEVPEGEIDLGGITKVVSSRL
jgi:hypothetical protein